MRKLIPVLVSILLSLGAMAGETDKSHLNKTQAMPTVGKQGKDAQAPAKKAAPAKPMTQKGSGHDTHAATTSHDSDKTNSKEKAGPLPKAKPKAH